MKDFIKTSKTIILALVIVFGASYVYAWTGPTQAPASGNAKAPINVSDVSQYKDGALSIGGIFRAYSRVIFDGNVGIGTVSPSTGGEQNLRLDVEGAVGAQWYCDEYGDNCVLGNTLGGGNNIKAASGQDVTGPDLEKNLAIIDLTSYGFDVGGSDPHITVSKNSYNSVNTVSAGYCGFNKLSKLRFQVICWVGISDTETMSSTFNWIAIQI